MKVKFGSEVPGQTNFSPVKTSNLADNCPMTDCYLQPCLLGVDICDVQPNPNGQDHAKKCDCLVIYVS